MKWINIKDEQPDPNREKYKAHVEVLGWDGKRVWHLTYRGHFKQTSLKTEKLKVTGMFHTFCAKCLDGEVVSGITHWMYFPEPPKKEK